MNKILAVLYLAAVLSLTAPGESIAAPDHARQLLSKLHKEGLQVSEIKWNEDTDTPTLLAGRLTEASNHSPQWIGLEWMRKTKKFYGIKDPSEDLKVAGIERSAEGEIRLRLKHLLFGTPVWGDWLMIGIDSQGVIRRVEGSFHPNLEKKRLGRPMCARMPKAKAVHLGMSSLTYREQIAGEPKTARYYLPSRAGCPLVYVVTFRLKGEDAPSSSSVMIHALTRRVIGQFP